MFGLVRLMVACSRELVFKLALMSKYLQKNRKVVKRRLLLFSSFAGVEAQVQLGVFAQVEKRAVRGAELVS